MTGTTNHRLRARLDYTPSTLVCLSWCYSSVSSWLFFVASAVLAYWSYGLSVDQSVDFIAVAFLSV